MTFGWSSDAATFDSETKRRRKAGSSGERRRDQLDGDVPVEREVGRPVDDAHAALARYLFEAVTSEDRPDGRVVHMRVLLPGAAPGKRRCEAQPLGVLSAGGRRREHGPMSRELEPWGGELRLPGWVRRLLRRSAGPGDSPERTHEGRQPRTPDVSVAENADRAVFGGFSEGHPGNKRR